ncbi:MAG: hypothetical protein ABJO57_05690 [Lentilitoribacter sp.]
MAFRYKSLVGFVSLVVFALTGCNSTESVLQPIPSASNNTTPPSSAAVTQQVDQGILVSFLPVTGAPADKLSILSQTLAEKTKENGITIVSVSNAEAQYTIKGFLSAFSDEANTTIVYVWDILDPTGARIYRIQGQSDTIGAGTDPWQFVTPQVMQEIASKSVTEFVNWQRQQS